MIARDTKSNNVLLAIWYTNMKMRAMGWEKINLVACGYKNIFWMEKDDWLNEKMTERKDGVLTNWLTDWLID